MEQLTEKTIDIDSLLKSKMGAKAKWVPGFLVSWLKRIAHQDQVNRFLWESRDKVGTPWLEECVRYLDMTLVVKGKENLPAPDDGRLSHRHTQTRISAGSRPSGQAGLLLRLDGTTTESRQMRSWTIQASLRPSG